MNYPHRLLLKGLAVTCLAFLAVPDFTIAQSTNRQVGTQFEVTADPLVQRPNEQPCVVPLFANYTFAHFADTEQTFQFTPSGNCPGPWKKVVFEVDFSENGGVQFDRTASIYFANTNMYFGTTPEPLATLTNTWHVERDVTDYSSLLLIPQQGAIVLANCTDDCPPPYNTLNGVFTVSANLEFYPSNDNGHAKQTNRIPDVVLPLEQVNSSGGINLPATLQPTDQLSTTFTLPTNIERVYLDVVSQSQSTDEQWYACFPNDLSSINLVYGCGNTDFRESEVMIDGTPAGLAPVSPWVFTGFLPDQWVPSPGVQTLDFVPYRVDLTPFAGVLSDGNPHTVSMTVFNDDGYFSATASLLLFLDSGSTQVTGAVTSNTLVAPSPVVTENLQGTSTVTGTIGVVSDRTFTIAGYVNTSHGKVSTAIAGQQNFSSTQTIDFDTVNATVLDQKTAVLNKVSTVTTTSFPGTTLVAHHDFSFPISVDFTYPVSSALFGFTVATGQQYESNNKVFDNGELTWFSSTTNRGNATDVSPGKSSQEFSNFSSDGTLYDCFIASTSNTLAKVSPGCTQDGDNKTSKDK